MFKRFFKLFYHDEYEKYVNGRNDFMFRKDIKSFCPKNADFIYNEFKPLGDLEGNLNKNNEIIFNHKDRNYDNYKVTNDYVLYKPLKYHLFQTFKKKTRNHLVKYNLQI